MERLSERFSDRPSEGCSERGITRFSETFHDTPNIRLNGSFGASYNGNDFWRDSSTAPATDLETTLVIEVTTDIPK